MPAGRLYTARMPATSISAAKDLLRITAPTASQLQIHAVNVSTKATAAQQLAIQLQRSTNDGTGGTAAVFTRNDPGLAAYTSFSGASGVYNLSADTTAGDIFDIRARDVRVGWEWTFTPELRYLIVQGGRFVVRVNDAPSPAVTFLVTVDFEVFG